ncbi:hypothetical protein OQI87_08950 [Lactobacillus kefiranofaciens]|uniref:hypothetical protein n=1 Tax=Lactobacillus kefiranofaciens TaxID=267818 RepID=UPI00246909EA|nr:hypothetical protein [Lactobacillus kefiranofaciens]MDH5101196.1 hypothetical protein [Lactobacillus kefiranofaciens]
MDEINLFAIGILVGIIVYILMVAFGSQKRKHKYDERQKIIRAQGIKWGFIVLVCGELVVTCFIKNNFFVKYSITINFAVIMLSLTVLAVYDILHGAYFAFNEKHIKSDSWLDFVLGICFILGYSNDANNVLSILGVFWLVIGVLSLFMLHRGKESDRL